MSWVISTSGTGPVIHSGLYLISPTLHCVTTMGSQFLFVLLGKWHLEETQVEPYYYVNYTSYVPQYFHGLWPESVWLDGALFQHIYDSLRGAIPSGTNHAKC